jgi:hypothetical protein
MVAGQCAMDAKYIENHLQVRGGPVAKKLAMYLFVSR